MVCEVTNKFVSSLFIERACDGLGKRYRANEYIIVFLCVRDVS